MSKRQVLRVMWEGEEHEALYFRKVHNSGTLIRVLFVKRGIGIREVERSSIVSGL